jgi:putative ABC transport system permease protein
MALGASPANILAQFLVEALSLSVAGGLMGVAAGIAVARWIAQSYQWLTLIQPQVIAIAVGFSAVVGILFGIYPARRASELDPIEALRFE